jgi:hypothetical protein
MFRTFTTVALLVGCGVETDGVDPIAKIGGGCAPWECGTNSPQISAYGFHELNLSGQPEPESQFRLLDFKLAGNSYTLQVVNGRMIATNAGGAIFGQGLVGAYMLVGQSTVDTYAIQIQEVGTVAYWAGGGVKTIESYLLAYAPAPGGVPFPTFQNLCSNPPPRGSSESRNMDPTHALVFEGDRIDGFQKKEYGIDRSWFNIGCAGHTLAKMYLTGHVQAAEVDGFVTTQAERTAIIKMFSADYCGTGAAYTVSGMPLDYRDDLGWLAYPVPAPVSLEARWSETGATCVRSLRGDVDPTKDFSAAFPNGPRPQMTLDGCHPATCRDNNPNLLGTAHLVSGNP